MAGAGTNTTLSLEARIRDIGTNVQIAGTTLILQTDNGATSWNCTGGTLSAKFRPVACR